VKRWTDLDEVRREIAAQAKAIAMAAGMEGVRVSVRIDEPSKRGVRLIEVSVAQDPGRALIKRAR
jgi:hypothetical protein